MHRPNFRQRSIALLLPALILWAWFACLAVCAENTEHNSAVQSSVITHQGQQAVSRGECPELCQIKALPAALQADSSNAAVAAPLIEITALFRSQKAIVSPVLKPDIKQNSPPAGHVPRFLRLRVFRI